MASRLPFEKDLDDGREVVVVEWEYKGQIMREVVVKSLEAARGDEYKTVGPRPVGRMEEVVAGLPRLNLPKEVELEVTRVLRAGEVSK